MSSYSEQLNRSPTKFFAGINVPSYYTCRHRPRSNNAKHGDLFRVVLMTRSKMARLYATEMLVTSLIHGTLSSTYSYLNDRGRG